MPTLKPKPGFDWARITWSPADGRITPLCSYCHGHIAEDDIPLTMWDEAGRMAHFCDPCMETWWGMEGDKMPAARPINRTVFRVRYMTTDGVPHVYCNVYAAPAAGVTYASLGLLTMNKADFEAFQRDFKAEFIDDLRQEDLHDQP